MSLKMVTATELQTLIDSKADVVIDFYADWCGPCRALTPELEKLATAAGDTTQIVKLDVDADPEFASKYGVQSIPTVVRVVAGEEKARAIGTRNASQLAKALGLDSLTV